MDLWVWRSGGPAGRWFVGLPGGVTAAAPAPEERGETGGGAVGGRRRGAEPYRILFASESAL
ncbi:hypothetical protein Plo01_76350 [Planobispora longispora]|uniref:Uncharacterized protein n=1 Tax=Planobispora longispora TaxID=28887 RepID=A0A8J3RQT9_9ACTN|nr:hypothetical protein Plo01_76350 [Planobispora longispora]